MVLYSMRYVLCIYVVIRKRNYCVEKADNGNTMLVPASNIVPWRHLALDLMYGKSTFKFKQIQTNSIFSRFTTCVC